MGRETIMGVILFFARSLLMFRKNPLFKLSSKKSDSVSKSGSGFDHGGDLVICKITFDVSKKSTLNLSSKNSDSVSKSGSKGAQKKKLSNKNLETTASSTSKSVNAVRACVLMALAKRRTCSFKIFLKKRSCLKIEPSAALEKENLS